MTTIDAIVLAGGRASRMGGRDKVMLDIDGKPLLQRAIEAVAEAECRHISVVGPERKIVLPAGANVQFVREEPPFSGPVAAIETAVDLGSSDWVLMLASDVPHIAEVVSLLVEVISAKPDVPAHLIESPDGYLEWLSSAIRRDVLDRELAALPDRSVGVRRLFHRIEFVQHADPRGITRDVDTPEQWDDAKRAWESGV